MSLKAKLIHIRWQARFGVCNPRTGICGMLCENTNMTKEDTKQLLDLFRKWPESSGSVQFPVPYEGRSAVSAYEIGRATGTMWSIFCKYGRARRRLLNWMIKQL